MDRLRKIPECAATTEKTILKLPEVSSLPDYLPESFKKDELRSWMTVAQNASLEEMLNDRPEPQDKHALLIALAHPAVCAARLGMDGNDVTEAFSKYINREEITGALLKWKKQNQWRLERCGDSRG